MVFEQGLNRPYYDYIDGRTIKMGIAGSTTSIAAWGSPKGIDCFAWITAHENKHHVQIVGFWPVSWIAAQDNDRDWLKDLDEPAYMAGRPYDPTKAATYPDTIGYGENPLRDTEDICMREQRAPYNLDPLWENGSANDADWAYPGKNSQNPY